MSEDKRKVLYLRGIWCFIAVVCWVALLIVARSDLIKLYFMELAIFSSIYAVYSLIFVCCKVYKYNGVKIELYNGFFCKYVRVNGQIVKECKVWLLTHTISLEYTLDNGDKLEALFFLRCKLRVNNKLVNHITF